jgi:hypothetical protein
MKALGGGGTNKPISSSSSSFAPPPSTNLIDKAKQPPLDFNLFLQSELQRVAALPINKNVNDSDEDNFSRYHSKS